MGEGIKTVATVSDGMDAVLLLATLVSGLRGIQSRTDLNFAEARSRLSDISAADIDLLIIAPSSERRSNDMLRAIVASGEARGATVLFALAEGMSVPEGMPGHIRFLNGPEFPKGTPDDLLSAASVASSPAEPDPTTTEKPPPTLRNIASQMLGHLGKRKAAAPEAASVTTRREAWINTVAIQGTVGGVGTTTLATGLAVALARQFQQENAGREVCLIDLDLQFGAVGCYLGLPPNTRVSDLYRNIAQLDSEAFQASLQTAEPGLKILAAPPDLVPVDALSSDHLAKLLRLARAEAACVIVDMPSVITDWTEQAYRSAERIYTVNTLEVRSAAGARKRAKVFEALALPASRVAHVLNRLPCERGQRAIEWRIRKKSYEKGLDSTFSHLLPDGAAEVGEANDMGRPLKSVAASNALTRALDEMAKTLGEDIKQPSAVPEIQTAEP